MAGPGAVMEREEEQKEKETRDRGREGGKKEKGGRLMSRQLHSGGHQSNTM